MNDLIIRKKIYIISKKEEISLIKKEPSISHKM